MYANVISCKEQQFDQEKMDANDPWLMDQALPIAGVSATMIPRTQGQAFPGWGTSGCRLKDEVITHAIEVRRGP